MSPMEFVRQIKAARRAELEEVERERQRQAEDAVRWEAMRFEESVTHVLAAEKATWLAEFRSGSFEDYGRWSGAPVRAIRFDIPGHLPIHIRLMTVSDEWATAGEFSAGDMDTWVATLPGGGVQHCDRLADALIAAEIEQPERGVFERVTKTGRQK